MTSRVASLSGSGPTRSPLRQRLSTIARPAASPGLIVSQVEYRLTLSRGTLRAGRVALEAVDRGRDPHDLRVRPLSGGRETAAPQLKPGQRWQTTVLLRPGIYELWCSLPEHARLGMRMRLTVVR